MSAPLVTALQPGDLLAVVIAIYLWAIAVTVVSFHPRYRHLHIDDHPNGCLEHYPCEHPDCDLIICYRHLVEGDTACPGTVEPGCSHHDALAACDEHRLEVCLGCRIDAADDAGLLDRGYGGWR